MSTQVELSQVLQVVDVFQEGDAVAAEGQYPQVVVVVESFQLGDAV